MSVPPLEDSTPLEFDEDGMMYTFLSSEFPSWDEAKQACENMPGFSLVMPKTENSFNFLSYLSSKYNDSVFNTPRRKGESLNIIQIRLKTFELV